MKFKTRNTYKRHLRTRHGKELMTDGVRLMPREQFLLVRTKPYLHDDQTTPDDVIQDLLSGQNQLMEAESLADPTQSTSQQFDELAMFNGVPVNACDNIKVEPL